MIVICIKPFHDDCGHTREHCRINEVPYGDWFPQKDSLYEVVDVQTPGCISYQGCNIFYSLFEDPQRGNRTWNASFFKEVEIETHDIECEVEESILL
jgi:hypothetical protein